MFILIMSAERHGLVEIESQISFEGIGSEPQPFSKIAPWQSENSSNPALAKSDNGNF